MKLNCETHNFKQAAEAPRAEYNAKQKGETPMSECDACGVKHPVGENIVFNDLIGWNLCEICWESMTWN